MRICCCDDDKVQCTTLNQMLLQNGNHKITIYQSAEEMLFECQNHFPFDLILLDVQMDQINGIELARKIRSIDLHVPIVFLTSMKEYVFEGYEVAALRYCLKPVTQQKIDELIALVQKHQQKEEVQFLMVEVNHEMLKIAYHDIYYIEAQAHICLIHTQKQVTETKSTIKNLLSQLDDTFIMSHRSYIVNLKHVDRITKESCLLSNHESVPLSRNSIKPVNEAFIRYYQKENIYE